MNATFTKLRSGEWGVKVGGTVRAGDEVVVSKKDGSQSRERVEKVVYAGNGISICAIKKRKPAARRRRDDDGDYCGGICPVRGSRCCAKNGPCHDCV